MKNIVCDISGMGGRETGGYEWGCQVIAARTLRFLQNCKTETEHPRFKEYQNVTGICIPANYAAHKMDDFVCDHPILKDKGITGAMHQFGIAHGKKVFELGREKYLQTLREAGRTDEDFYEFDDAEAFPEQVPA